MEIHQIFQIIKKHVLLIIIISVLFTSAAGYISYYRTTPVYKATASLLVGKAPSGSGERVYYSDVLMYQMLVKTYIEIAKSKKVAERASARLTYDISPEIIRSMITTSNTNDTEIMYISVMDTDPGRASDIVNKVVDAFIITSGELLRSNNVRIVDYAKIPEVPTGYNPNFKIAIAFFIGLMVSAVSIFMMEYLDRTIKTIDEAKDVLKLPVLAMIPMKNKE